MSTSFATTDHSGHVHANGTDLYAVRRGTGPDVLLIAGLGDPWEAWLAQVDGLSGARRVTAFDNRGARRARPPSFPTPDPSGHVPPTGTALYAARRGPGPDVLLIAGLGAPWEAWLAQVDGLSGARRVTAFDNRGAGRSPLPDEPFT